MSVSPPTQTFPSRPGHLLPKDACDAHCHIFGPADRFPYAPGRSYTPEDAPYEHLAALHAYLGFSRAVVVQGNCHGNDHGALLDALKRSKGSYRGVALLTPDVDDGTLHTLHEHGVRAARFNFVAHLGGAPTVETFKAVVARIAPLGWHVCVHTDPAALRQWLPRLADLPVPFVVDHMARIDASRGVEDPDFLFLLQLAELKNAWIKVSGIDRISPPGLPFVEAISHVRLLAQAMPERALWGTDWPHPNVAGAVPDEGELVNAFFAACTDPGLRQAILVDNPARLYGFR